MIDLSDKTIEDAMRAFNFASHSYATRRGVIAAAEVIYAEVIAEVVAELRSPQRDKAALHCTWEQAADFIEREFGDKS